VRRLGEIQRFGEFDSLVLVGEWYNFIFFDLPLSFTTSKQDKERREVGGSKD
jgi:hypothetical protein